MTAVLLSTPAPEWCVRMDEPFAALERWAVQLTSFRPLLRARPMNAAADTSPQIGPDVVARIAAGDTNAFTELYDAFSGALYSLSFKILGSAEEAEDVLQGACLRIWDDAARYSADRGTPFTWAYTITRSKALDRLRLRQRRAQLMQDGGLSQLTAEASNGASTGADDELVARERATAVRSALGGLPEDQRQAIELAFFSGLTQHEIAERLGEPLGTVKARIRRGMMRLRTPLSKLL